MRKLCKRYSAIMLLVMLFFAAFPLQVAADVPEQAKEVIRVGYIPFDHMIKYDDNKGYYGYGITYLNELAKITGWTYEFVEVSESERMEKLINGEIDLLCSIHKDCQEKDELLFCDNAAGLEYGMLATLKNNNHIFFDDYSSIDGKKIGINVNSDLEHALERYAREKGITYQPVYFEDLKDMQIALNRMSIDIMLVSSLRDLSNIKYVGKTYSIEEYFTTSKNNPELMEELNEAEHELKRERPFYNSALYEAFYGKPSEKLIGMTREEYNIISMDEPIRVVCDAKSFPIEYRDETTGEYAGIYAEGLRLISEQSGLNFEFTLLDDYSQAWEMIRTGEADIIAGSYGNSNLGQRYGLIYSESYISAEYTMVGRINGKMAETEIIALPRTYIGLQEFVRKEEPFWKIKLYDGVDACLEAVHKGEADLTTINSIFLQTVYNINSYGNLRILPNMSKKIPISVGIARNNENAQVLRNIINKAIYQIPQEEFQKCVTENAINIAYEPSVKETIQKLIPYMLLTLFIVIAIVTMYISKREKHYRHLALTDTLTGLWNGVKFYHMAGERLERNPDREYLMISLDINKFKFVNNDFGTHAGDQILIEIAKRIEKIFGGVAYYARGTADVFLILIEEKNYRDEMLKPLCKEVYFDNSGKQQYYKVVIKAGICRIAKDEDRSDVTKFVDQASLARKTIKDSADQDIAYYDEEIKENIARDIDIENKMEEALENGEFKAYLQPKYSLSDEKIIGAEALVRWWQPDGKMIPPDMFIPLFERNGFIVKVDFSVYEQVMKQMSKWTKEGKKPIVVSVNVSRVHVGTYDFFIKLNKLIEKYHIPKECFELELTETIVGSEKNSTKEFIRECKKEGYNVSIDDFGSGYSSLNLLKDLPVDILKIDKEFLNETEESQRSSIIVQQVVEMAKKMDIGTLCEGVETQKQAEFLKEIGCDMAQGYLFSRPIPMDEFGEMI